MRQRCSSITRHPIVLSRPGSSPNHASLSLPFFHFLISPFLSFFPFSYYFFFLSSIFPFFFSLPFSFIFPLSSYLFSLFIFLSFFVLSSSLCMDRFQSPNPIPVSFSHKNETQQPSHLPSCWDLKPWFNKAAIDIWLR